LWIAQATLVVVVVAVALLVVVPFYQHHTAVREIERLGGLARTRPGGPEWLRRRIGDERMKIFDDVIAVHLEGEHVTDSVLARMRCLPELEGLDLENTKITDLGLAHLSAFQQLEDLMIYGANITDK